MTTHTQTTPTDSAPLLAAAKQKFGFVPNLLTQMAPAPPLLAAYLQLAGLFEGTSLSPTERQIVLLATSVENQCGYCVAAHTVIAGMQQVDPAVVEALRLDRPLANGKWEALRRFAAEVASRRGWPTEAAREAFHAAGYTEVQALEVVLGVGVKTLSNYTNHLKATALDAPFAKAAWQPKAK